MVASSCFSVNAKRVAALLSPLLVLTYNYFYSVWESKRLDSMRPFASVAPTLVCAFKMSLRTHRK